MKNLRKILTVCTFVFVVMAVVGTVYGVTVPTADDIKGNTNVSSTVENVGKGVWTTVTTIVQILAVAAVVFAGVRYMFASADAKADIKKQTVILIVGAVLVFGSTAILNFISKATSEIL